MKTWVKYWRVRQGMTQAELAIKAGTTQHAISDIEQGTGNPTLRTLDRISDALNVHLADLRINWKG